MFSVRCSIHLLISDSDEEEPEPEPVLSENTILQIKNNDPTLINLTIDMVENGLNNSSTDWAQLGTDIGRAMGRSAYHKTPHMSNFGVF